jgi:hypothetical protein
MIDAWFDEADKSLVLPLDDRPAVEVPGTPRPAEEEPRERYVYLPGASPVPEGVAVNTRGRSYKILADVGIADPKCPGVIFAHGSRFLSPAASPPVPTTPSVNASPRRLRKTNRPATAERRMPSPLPGRPA